MNRSSLAWRKPSTSMCSGTILAFQEGLCKLFGGGQCKRGSELGGGGGPLSLIKMEEDVRKVALEQMNKQTIIQNLLTSSSPSEGSSLPSEAPAELEEAFKTARIAHKKKSILPELGHRRSSHSRSSRSKSEANSGLESKKPSEKELVFDKEQPTEIKTSMHSPLSMALAARMAEEEDPFEVQVIIPAGKVKVRVFLPISASDEEGDQLDTFVEFYPDKILTGLGLVKQCLKLYQKRRQKSGPELDPSTDKYELRIAEEDGEVDHDLPALSLQQTIEEIGQTCFAITRKHADADAHQAASIQSDLMQTKTDTPTAFCACSKNCCSLQ
eukprot:g82305.t1